RVIPHALSADVFEYLDLDAQQKLLRAMAHEQVVGILNEMSPDDRTALLEELPSAAARQLIKLLTPEERGIARALLGYPEGSVGRLMTPDLIAVDAGWSVKEVLDYVRENGQDSETLNVIYVVDDRGKLLEELPSAAARQLIKLLTPEERGIARALLGYPEGSVGRLMTPDLIAVDAGWSVKEVLDYVRENGQDSETLNVIYVVDDRGKLL